MKKRYEGLGGSYKVPGCLPKWAIPSVQPSYPYSLRSIWTTTEFWPPKTSESARRVSKGKIDRCQKTSWHVGLEKVSSVRSTVTGNHVTPAQLATSRPPVRPGGVSEAVLHWPIPSKNRIMSKKSALIIGAGPAGLTLAYELLTRTDIIPVVFEASHDIGGLSKTVNYKGNRMDIGGHRFFSKSDRVMNWWREMMPIETISPGETSARIHYQRQSRGIKASSIEGVGENPDANRVMLLRKRLSRILYGRKLYNYPISLSVDTVANLGLIRTICIGFSYLAARLNPIREEKSLEDFLINRFGKELYRTFFEDYTEKVWGVPCRDISAEWGAQRIKGLSITKAVIHALRKMTSKSRNNQIGQKDTETSLIEHFLYPKFGPGQMWESVAERIHQLGGQIHFAKCVTGIEWENGTINAVTVTDTTTKGTSRHTGDYLFSTMPVCDLIRAMGEKVPESVRQVADGLQYRDFITVGVLLKKFDPSGIMKGRDGCDTIKDNWIYIQEPDVRVGRLQIFNNWSPYMVRNPDTIWLGMEYFCNEGDSLWSMSDPDFIRFAIAELVLIGAIKEEDVLDHTVIRIPKTYPAYFGSYGRFGEIRAFTDGIHNLFLIGRNGMHKYNNADHSMLTAMVALDTLLSGSSDKSAIWEVNTEMNYHEEKSGK